LNVRFQAGNFPRQRAAFDTLYAECARLLALNMAHYRSKFGELPLEETLVMISMDKPNEEQIQLMNDGMELFVGVLGNVVLGIGQERH
jgi:hypothetical protein